MGVFGTMQNGFGMILAQITLPLPPFPPSPITAPGHTGNGYAPSALSLSRSTIYGKATGETISKCQSSAFLKTCYTFKVITVANQGARL